MKTVCEPNQCAGCMACLEACPKQAISIRDHLDAYNAEIDETLCIHCNACFQVCPQRQEEPLNAPLLWQQGWAENREVPENSSSGGVGAELIRSFLANHGKVCTCRFHDGGFFFDFVSSQEEIPQYVGSKYVKSNPEGIYSKIKSCLREGEKVLFIGLPCQVAAVRRFCGQRLLQNLYTVDLICHGTPSPQLLEQYLRERGHSLQHLQNIQFRKKVDYGLCIDNTQIVPQRVQDLYMAAFLEGLNYTENCYFCKFARLERVSDLTIGDAWGSELPDEEKRKGISLILCQTEKGRQLLEAMHLHLLPVDLQKAVQANTQLRRPTPMPKKRARFFALLQKTGSFVKAMVVCHPRFAMKQYIKSFLIKRKLLPGEHKP